MEEIANSIPLEEL